jgi:hypothetical protein
MPILSSIITWAMKKRAHQTELFIKYPLDVQNDVFLYLIDKAKDTEWGKKHHYRSIKSQQDFQKQVPISTYETIFPYIERLMKGEQNLLWPTEITWFSKSSGTTNARSKFIPVSEEALQDCHVKAGKDMMCFYINNFNHKALFKGKTLSLGGSLVENPYQRGSYTIGDVSAIFMTNLPFWAEFMRAPNLDTALIGNWDQKLDRMLLETPQENVTSFSGVPTWVLVLIRKILEVKQVDNILDIWPNLELFAHGGVAFEPYRGLFKELIPKDDFNYQEVYNASEGFFGIQDEPNRDDLLLMLDYGIFYEFIPMDQLEKVNPKALTLQEVQLGVNYALVISTNAGLWRYMIGDTVKFTSRYPFRVKISGRTKHFINAFGEELIVENADKAILEACTQTGAIVSNYTAGPRYIKEGNKGGHEWVIEFEQAPKDLNKFADILDKTIREINSDYDAKRQHDLALTRLVIHDAPRGTFYKWMASRGKLGAQHKVPRLANSREYLDSVLQFLN